MARWTDAERQRIGLRDWLNGEIDAANLNALAARSRLAVDDVPSGWRIIGRTIDRAAVLRIFPAPLPARRDCWNGCAVRRRIAG